MQSDFLGNEDMNEINRIKKQHRHPEVYGVPTKKKIIASKNEFIDRSKKDLEKSEKSEKSEKDLEKSEKSKDYEYDHGYDEGAEEREKVKINLTKSIIIKCQVVNIYF